MILRAEGGRGVHSDGGRSESAHGIALLACQGLSPALIEQCVVAVGGVSAAFALLVENPMEMGHEVAELGVRERAESIRDALRRIDLDLIDRALTRIGARVLVRGRHPYPELLAAVEQAPIMLVVAGRTEVFDLAAVAVVGTRRASLAGLKSARRLGRELSEAGVAVVSGLALGIDAAVHSGVLDAEVADRSAPIGVLGCGLDVIYPKRNRGLFELVLEHGVLVSQFGLGASPERWRFPVRNRTIAGLSHGAVVVEAFATGGALSTAAAAREIGREVMAVPGSPENPATVGTFELLRDGATPVASAADILFATNITPFPIHSTSGTETEAGSKCATGPSRQILQLLGDGEAHTAFEIADFAGIDTSRAIVTLGRLIATGQVRRVDEGLFASGLSKKAVR